MIRGHVRRLDAPALAAEIDALPAGGYLWQPEYPGKPTLQVGGLSRSGLPPAGRIIARDFELRFFDAGARGILLLEEPLPMPQASDAVYAARLHEPVRKDALAPVHEGPPGWRLSFYEYVDEVGRVVWVRWRAVPTEKASHA